MNLSFIANKTEKALSSYQQILGGALIQGTHQFGDQIDRMMTRTSNDDYGNAKTIRAISNATAVRGVCRDIAGLRESVGVECLAVADGAEIKNIQFHELHSSWLLIALGDMVLSAITLVTEKSNTRNPVSVHDISWP